MGKQETESKSHVRNAGGRGKEKKIKKRQEEVGEVIFFPGVLVSKHELCECV